MKNKITSKSEAKSRLNNRIFVAVGSVLVVFAVSIFLWYKNAEIQKVNRTTPATSSAKKTSDAELDQLVGRWARTDSEGAYIIEIKGASAEGKLEAAYYNPTPINVGYAEWKRNGSKLIVFVELSDTNYPGSTYTLNFFPTDNRMSGKYYQAVEHVNFDVEFIRIE